MKKLSKLTAQAAVTVSLLSVAAPTFTTVAQASEISADTLSDKDVNNAIDNLAQVLEAAHEADPNVDTEEMARGVMAYASGDAQETTLRSLSRLGRYETNGFSSDRFGKCMLNKMGLGELKNLAKVIFKPATVRYLKSHAWKKASAMMVKAIVKYAPKKVASLAVKRIANLALPGIGWASVAWWGAQCGWDEFH
ncbi:hypothetical protein [Lactobacillus helveticus]|uniref:hypothetical protein n=1 Tax=Lactobacillus helveticus TaxID=1587 RepID=UPI001F11E585|nr:hypothetical protein [Lactobacillus helveticus]